MTPDDMLYEAERAVMMMRYPVRFADGEGAAAFFEHVVGTRWFASRWPAVVRRRITVKESRLTHAYADYSTNTILLPTWALCDFVLLHEVAHMCAARERSEQHGPIFRRAHHDLIRRFMSRDAARCYRYSCLAYDLDF